MTDPLYSRLLISGVDYTNHDSLRVRSSMSENYSSSTADINFINPFGRNVASFDIGDELQVYAGSDNPPTVKIFDGVVKEITYEGKGSVNETIRVNGADYTDRLHDFTVEPNTYLDMEIGSIVRDIMSTNTEGISYSGVQTTNKTLSVISFNQTPVFDALKQLADQVDYIYYVDTDKDLHFEPIGSVSTGYTFNSTNVLTSNFITNDSELANDIWVYGAPTYIGDKSSYTPSGGSVFGVNYLPHNVNVTVAGSLKIGGITPGVNNDYWVDYDRRKIIFVSGTEYGNKIPSSGTVGSPVVINYEYAVPLYVRDIDDDSINNYGRKVKIITDENIKDATMAWDVCNANMALYKDPRKEGDLELYGINPIFAGQTCVVNLPYENINSQTYDLLEVNYDFNAENNFTSKVISVKVSQRIKDIVDVIKNILLSLRKLEVNQLSYASQGTKDRIFNGSYAMDVSAWYIDTRSIGSSFILAHPTNGVIGSYTSHTLGDWSTAYAVSRSGGTWE